MDRAAIVTGSDSGIGRATAVALAAAGCDVGITWHTDEEGANGTAEEVRGLGRRAEVRRLDLSELPGGAGVIDDLATSLGRLDVLVNNAGTGSSSPFVELGWDEWTHVLDVDLSPHGITVNAVAPGEIAAAMTGNEDADPHGIDRPGIPLGRPGDAREIAAAIAHLASRRRRTRPAPRS